MEPIKPLSVKFEPTVRKGIKEISSLLDWHEGQFVNASVVLTLELIKDRSLSHLHKTIFLAQQAMDFDKIRSKLPAARHSPDK